VTPAPRSYRGKQSRVFPVWNGILEHRERIGDAIWEFLWCLDGITEETPDDIGKVQGGAPIKAEQIAAVLKRNPEATRKHLRTLRDEKYIRTRRTPYGLVIDVLHSKKFGIWRKEKQPTGVSQPERYNPQLSPIQLKVANKEDSAVERQQEAAAAPASTTTHNPEESVWTFLKIQPCGPTSFRSLLEAGWASRNGSGYSKLIGDAVDAWEATEDQKLKNCAPFFRALAELRRREMLIAQEDDPADYPQIQVAPWGGFPG
jgi:hypothetical protein